MTVKEEIKKEVGVLGGVKNSHPCFGGISVSKINSNGTQLVGSDVDVNTFIKLDIHQSEITQKLSTDFYYNNNCIVSVYLTPVQYSEMIANPAATSHI